MWLLTYARSSPRTPFASNICAPEQPVTSLMYAWFMYHQEIPAIISAVSSAMLVVLSVRLNLTDEEKHCLRTGRAQKNEQNLESEVQENLNARLGLNQLAI